MVVLQVLPDSWKIDLQVNINVREHIRPTDAREFKNLGGLDRTIIKLTVNNVVEEYIPRLTQH
jgi:hypothetical protein